MFPSNQSIPANGKRPRVERDTLRVKYLAQEYNLGQGLREARWPNGQCTGLQIGQSGFEPWPGHCVVFLGKILYSHSASLHPGV